MSRSVRVLSRLQLPPETLARFRRAPEIRETPPDVVFYTGCNVLRTPHIALLALDVLDKLGTSYEVMGGVGQCCGVYQFREGDFANNSVMAHATIEGLAAAGTPTVLSWCPSCQLSIGEVSLPNYTAQFGEKPFDLNPFLVFLGDRADALKAMMVKRVAKRVALHERPVFPQTMEAVRRLASVVPGLELVELDVPRIGVQANTISPPKFKQELIEREFALATEAGVDVLATIYHADHREICDAATGKSFEIVNFMELLGDGLGIDSDDAYKRLKQIKEIDDIIVETAPMIEANKLDLETVRDALAFEFGG
jgi:Fe-S oxidoreductase